MPGQTVNMYIGLYSACKGVQRILEGHGPFDIQEEVRHDEYNLVNDLFVMDCSREQLINKQEHKQDIQAFIELHPDIYEEVKKLVLLADSRGQVKWCVPEEYDLLSNGDDNFVNDPASELLATADYKLIKHAGNITIPLRICWYWDGGARTSRHHVVKKHSMRRSN